MAHHKSAIRQERRSIRRAAVNKQNKSSLRSQIRKAREAMKNNNPENLQKVIQETYSVIDKSVKKGTIHANKGARFKSRLTLGAKKITPKPSK